MYDQKCLFYQLCIVHGLVSPRVYYLRSSYLKVCVTLGVPISWCVFLTSRIYVSSSVLHDVLLSK